jgi:hypothetical protein
MITDTMRRQCGPKVYSFPEKVLSKSTLRHPEPSCVVQCDVIMPHFINSCFDWMFTCNFSPSVNLWVAVALDETTAVTALERQAGNTHFFVIQKLFDLPALEAGLKTKTVGNPIIPVVEGNEQIAELFALTKIGTQVKLI